MAIKNPVILTSRIRFARNLQGYNFSTMIKGTASEREINAKVSNLFSRVGGYNFYKMSDLSEDDRNSLYERYFISKNLLSAPNGAVAINRDKSISIMVNEEDHVREQCILQGFDLDGAYNKICYVDDMLARNLRFSQTNKFYYTTCPSNLGTGMRASVMMFLPALTYTGRIHFIMKQAVSQGITIRGAFGEGSVAEGFWYQVSNSRTIGNAQTILQQVNTFIQSVNEQEIDERLSLYSEYKTQFEDTCFRAYGILRHAKMLSYAECMENIAKVKLACSLDFMQLKNSEALDDLLVAVRPSTLKLLTGNQDDLQSRALYVNQALNTKIKIVD